MSFLRFYKFSCLNYLFAGALILSLVSCSGGDGGLAGDGLALGDINLSWAAPVVREDGNPILPNEISGYRIYYGASKAKNYANQFDINDNSTLSVKVSGVPVGTYYVVVTAVDTAGRESAYSTEVVIVL